MPISSLVFSEKIGTIPAKIYVLCTITYCLSFLLTVFLSLLFFAGIDVSTDMSSNFRAPRGVARYCFDPVCLYVCVCVLCVSVWPVNENFNV